MGQAAGAMAALALALASCGDDDVPPPAAGPTGCDAAVLVADPGSATGDTRDHGHLNKGSCVTGGAPEAYFSITAAATGMLDLTLESDVDLGLYVRASCKDADTEVDCADGGKAGEVETLSVPVTAGETVWAVVDGFSTEQAGRFTLSVQSRPVVCGDGLVEGSEACDPPDAVTCTEACEAIPEICDDGADNDLDALTDCEDAGDCAAETATCPLAMTCGAAPAAGPAENGDTQGGTGHFAGSCTGGALSPEALRAYVPAATGALIVTLESVTDQGVYLRAECVDPATEIGCLDDAPGGVDEILVVPVEADAAVTLFVDARSPDQAGPFTLHTSLEPSTEDGPNDAPASATVFSAPFVGTISPAGDVDYIQVAVPGPSSTLTVDVNDLGNGDCASFKVDSFLDIFGPDGVTGLASNDDAGDFCSRAQATGLAAGTYYVRVIAARMAPKPTFAYRLDVQIE
jgi:hypothetical protein